MLNYLVEIKTPASMYYVKVAAADLEEAKRKANLLLDHRSWIENIYLQCK